MSIIKGEILQMLEKKDLFFCEKFHHPNCN